MQVSVEKISEFMCESGHGWTIADFKKPDSGQLTCPTCEKTSPVESVLMDVKTLHHFLCRNQHWWSMRGFNWKPGKKICCSICKDAAYLGETDPSSYPATVIDVAIGRIDLPANQPEEV